MHKVNFSGEKTGEQSNLNPFEKNLNEDGTFSNQFDDSMNTAPPKREVIPIKPRANKHDFWADNSEYQPERRNKLSAFEAEFQRLSAHDKPKDGKELPPVRATKQLLVKTSSQSSMGTLKKGKTLKVSQYDRHMRFLRPTEYTAKQDYGKWGQRYAAQMSRDQ